MKSFIKNVKCVASQRMLAASTFMRKTYVQAAVMFVFMTNSPNSFAAPEKISAMFNSLKEEGSIIAPVILLLIAIAGMGFAGWGVISAISTKKQNQPLTWQIWAVVGGAVAIIIPTILFAMAGSLTGGDSQAASVFSDMQVDY